MAITATAPADAPPVRSYRRADALLAGVVLVLVGLIVQPAWSQQASRYALTAAVAEHGTTRIDAYDQTLGVDYAVKDGHRYSDKAPGQPLAAIPFYAVYRAVGGQSAAEKHVDHNLGIWWLSFWFSAVPAAALAVAMARAARRVAPAWGTLVGLALGAGTLVLPLGSLLFGHVLAALLAFAAFRLLLDRPEAGRVAAAGALAAGAVAVEYTAVLAVLVLTGLVLWKHRRRLGWYLLGASPLVVLVAAYQWIAFGSPVATSYQYSRFAFQRNGIGGLGPPDLRVAVDLLVGGRGLFVLSPICLVALIGLVKLRRDRPAFSVEATVSLAVVGAYLVFQSGWVDATGGDSPGPRHLIPALPFLAVGLAHVWPRWRVIATGAAVLSVGAMVVATLTYPMAPAATDNALKWWIERAFRGEVVDTLLSPVLGRVSVLLVVLGAAGLAAVLVRLERTDRTAPADRSPA